MGAARAGLSRLKARTLEHVASRRITRELREPAFSITFDDVRQSAVRNGVPILLDHDVEATFYVAAGLKPEDGFLEPRDIEELKTHGFDVGCHTFSHYRLKAGTGDGLARDATRNREVFERELQLRRPRDFCYPYGQVSIPAKRKIGQNYATARSTYPGLNTVGSDLLLLRSNALYSQSVNWQDVRRLLTEATERNGWVIFYTHGVESDPDAWSCVPEDLDRLLSESRRAGLSSRSVRSLSEEFLPDWST